MTELAELLKSHEPTLRGYAVLFLMEGSGSIGGFELDRLFHALEKLNKARSLDVLLVLLSPGGSIEPAYQVSKVCKSFAKSKFVVAVPRHAKSAATLIALGADEIHMGPLSQLGPIDPQLGGLPALGVKQALKTIAELSQQFPMSAEMFARYLRMALTVEQIGYCDRVSESAAQYAERLLSNKANLPETPSAIAKTLVYEYKDHGFVIDIEEGRRLLGEAFIRIGTPEIALAEAVYSHFDLVNLLLGVRRKKTLLVVGSHDGILILERRRE